MLTPDLAERIRSIFLQDQPHVTIETAARLLGMSDDEIAQAIDGGEIDVTTTCSGAMIDAHELATQALCRWPVTTIEDALGSHAALVMPAGVRTRRITVRLPRYIIAAVARLAEDRGQSVDALLACELGDLAVLHRDQLAAVIRGFAEAIDWPSAADEKSTS